MCDAVEQQQLSEKSHDVVKFFTFTTMNIRVSMGP